MERCETAAVKSKRSDVSFSLVQSPFLTFKLMQSRFKLMHCVINTNGRVNSTRIGTVLLAGRIDYGNRMAKVAQKQRELVTFARPIRHRVCWWRNSKRKIRTVQSTGILPLPIRLGAPVNRRRTGGVGLRGWNVGTSEFCD